MKSFKPNENFDNYLFFIKERMVIFWKRYFQQEAPYTEDYILKTHKFTNVYRALDRVSQFLIKEVIYNEKGLNNEYNTEDIFTRIILFKHFNKIETWQALEKEFGDITTDTPFSEIDKYLTSLFNQKFVIYNNAYMLTALFMKKEGPKEKFNIKDDDLKHTAYLKIWRKVINDGKMYQILRSNSLKKLIEEFNSIMAVGKFLSMQYAIDLNYSSLFDFDENTHIVAGPGAERGIQRTFDIEGKPNYVEIIKWVEKNLYNLLDDYGYEFNELPNRKPTLIDLQNCFCETDKYLRGIGVETEGVKGKKIKNYFKPKKDHIDIFLPPKWNVVLK